jgi:hypothetical protein
MTSKVKRTLPTKSRNLGARVAFGSGGQLLGSDIGTVGNAPEANAEDLLSSAQVRRLNVDHSIDSKARLDEDCEHRGDGPPWTQQRRIDEVGSVCSRHHCDVAQPLDAVKFTQKLMKHKLAFTQLNLHANLAENAITNTA